MPRLTSLAVAEQVFNDKNSAQNFLCLQLLLFAELTNTKHRPKVLLRIHKNLHWKCSKEEDCQKQPSNLGQRAGLGKGGLIAGLGLVGTK